MPRYFNQFAKVSFALSSVIIALMTLRIFVGPISLTMPNMSHYAELVPTAFGMHVYFASVALALAPFQMWARMR